MTPKFKAPYMRISRHAKAFEAVNSSQHVYNGMHRLDINSGNNDDLDVYSGVVGYTEDIPEGTPVFVTPDGLQVIDGAAAVLPDLMGYLVQKSIYYNDPYRRDEWAYGNTGVGRFANLSDNIQFIEAQPFQAVWSYYLPKGATTAPLDVSGGSEAAVGDLLIIRDKSVVAAEITGGLWSPGPIQNIGRTMPPVVEVKATAAVGDIVIGVVSEVRGLDSIHFKDTGFYKGGGVQDSANYFGSEILVNMIIPRIEPA